MAAIRSSEVTSSLLLLHNVMSINIASKFGALQRALCFVRVNNNVLACERHAFGRVCKIGESDYSDTSANE